MIHLQSLIKDIKKQPVLYFGSESITALWHYINGYALTNAVDHHAFNQYCALYFRDTAAISWHAILLKYANLNEQDALHLFFQIYESYVIEPNRIDSRLIVHKLLYYALLEIRFQVQQEGNKTIWKLSDRLHALPLALYQKTGGQILPVYDELLEAWVEKSEQDPFLRDFIFNNFTILKGCYWQIWKRPNEFTLVDSLSTYQPQKDEVLIKVFFAIARTKAITIYNTVITAY